MDTSTPATPSQVAQDIRDLADIYATKLKSQIDIRTIDMEADDNSHYLIYQVLGIPDEEGKLIDLYQNKGRFLYQYAGAFLEKAAAICFRERFPDSEAKRIPNTIGQKPKTFQIDCLIEKKDAIEIKWRDATTDGDHVTKENTRIHVIADAGYKPVRVMFYYPNRLQAIRIQQTLETLYAGVKGEYHYGNGAWEYVKDYTGVDLKNILEAIAGENVKKWQTSKL